MPAAHDRLRTDARRALVVLSIVSVVPAAGPILPECSVHPHRPAPPDSVPPPGGRSPRAGTNRPLRHATHATISSLGHPLPCCDTRETLLLGGSSSRPAARCRPP